MQHHALGQRVRGEMNNKPFHRRLILHKLITNFDYDQIV